MYIAIDLASRFSAVSVVAPGGSVILEYDSFGFDHVEFAQKIAHTALSFPEALIIAEDVPYGISNQKMIKGVLRLQGVLIAEMHRVNAFERLYFLSPVIWQRHFEGVWKGGVSGAAQAAKKLDYTPPNLLERYADKIPPLGKEHAKERASVRGNLKKSSTDYVDAFLIGVWAHHVLGDPRTLTAQRLSEISGLQPATK